MKAFKEFRREDKSFWFFIRFISEKLGYSRKGIVLTYTVEQIEKLCEKENIEVSPDRINKAVLYCNMRADLLNNTIEKNLMDVDEAEYSCAVKPPFRDAGYRRSRDGVPQIV